jgi:PAS domain S-box-containing protein
MSSPSGSHLSKSDPRTDGLQVITDAMAAPITRCSRDLPYLWVSRQYADWLGLSPDQIVGRPIVDVIGEQALKAIRPHFERALGGQKAEYEEQIFYKGIGERWIHAVYTSTFGSDGSPNGWVAVVTDVDLRAFLSKGPSHRSFRRRIGAWTIFG